ncbi:MAG: c-type cytochrome [Sphingobacteriaceae bacterium]
MNKLRVFNIAFLAIATAILVASCGGKRSPGLEYARNMYDPIAYNPDQANKNFKNGQTAQTPPANTMPVGFDKPEDSYPNTLEGYQAAGNNMSNPLPVNTETLEEGKSLFLNMCSQCHGLSGQGDGAIIKMGKFPAPPSYSTGSSSRGGAMKDLTDGKIFHTITYGVNLMGPHRYQLTPTERWKIVMYVHELQKLQ